MSKQKQKVNKGTLRRVLELIRPYAGLVVLTLVLAVLMAFSRMYLYVHYPTDILGGILVGCLTGAVGSWLAALLLQLNVYL